MRRSVARASSPRNDGQAAAPIGCTREGAGAVKRAKPPAREAASPRRAVPARARFAGVADGNWITHPGSRVTGAAARGASHHAGRAGAATRRNRLAPGRRLRRAKARRIADPAIHPCGARASGGGEKAVSSLRVTDHPIASFWQPARNGSRRCRPRFQRSGFGGGARAESATDAIGWSGIRVRQWKGGLRGTPVDAGPNRADRRRGGSAARHPRCASPWLGVTAVGASPSARPRSAAPPSGAPVPSNPDRPPPSQPDRSTLPATEPAMPLSNGR